MTNSKKMRRCRRFGDVTQNGVVFDWWPANRNGACFMLFKKSHHTEADIETAKAQLMADRDVVGQIRVLDVSIE